jgi:DNA repair protein RecO (recombination protein O)
MTLALQQAYILHRRAYRETSYILELFTPEFGRLSAVARGIRKVKSRTASLLQPFTPLLVSWFGKGEMVTLGKMEADGFTRALNPKNLRCGFYLNELLMRLLPKHDPHAEIFKLYHQTLEELRQDAAASEKILRLFEKRLLVEVGYGLPAESDKHFEDDLLYCFDVDRGFLPSDMHHEEELRFAGSVVNALLQENFEDEAVLQEIKRLMRYIFANLLGNRPLQSRSLFEHYKEVEIDV